MTKLKKIVDKRLAKLSDRNTLPARLGRADGTIPVLGKPYTVWVTYFDGSSVEALNRRVPNTWGALVLVGYDAVIYPNRRQVLGMWDVYPEVPWDGTPDHSASQQWPAPDTLYVRSEQFLPALVTPVANSLSVQVWPTTFLGASSWKRFTAIQSVDVSASVPATGARVSLLVVNSGGALALRDGSTVASRSLITDANIPLPLAGDNPIAGLILTAGMTELLKNEFRTDIIDLRFFDQSSALNHAAVTLGTANGLSLAGQVLSLALATGSAAGAMSAADYTKLSGIAAGAEVNVNADWNAASGDAQILNKPAITNPPATSAANDFQLGSGTGAWIKKTLAETVAILRASLDSVYALAAKGVTSKGQRDIRIRNQRVAGDR